jgi:hypothetical protein
LQKVFYAFACYGSGGAHEVELDSTKMMKLARDCGLLDAKLSPIDVDVFFLKVRRLSEWLTQRHHVIAY